MNDLTQLFYELFAGGSMLMCIAVPIFFFILPILVQWKILEKAGHKKELALLGLIPGLGLLLIFALYIYLAFSEWPIHRSRMSDGRN